MEGSRSHAFNMNRSCVIAGRLPHRAQYRLIDASVGTFSARRMPSAHTPTAPITARASGRRTGGGLPQQQRRRRGQHRDVRHPAGLGPHRLPRGSSSTVLIGEVLKRRRRHESAASFTGSSSGPPGPAAAAAPSPTSFPEHPPATPTSNTSGSSTPSPPANPSRTRREPQQLRPLLLDRDRALRHSGNFSCYSPPTQERRLRQRRAHRRHVHEPDKHAGGVNSLFADGTPLH